MKAIVWTGLSMALVSVALWSTAGTAQQRNYDRAINCSPGFSIRQIGCTQQFGDDVAGDDAAVCSLLAHHLKNSCIVLKKVREKLFAAEGHNRDVATKLTEISTKVTEVEASLAAARRATDREVKLRRSAEEEKDSYLAAIERALGQPLERPLTAAVISSALANLKQRKKQILQNAPTGRTEHKWTQIGEYWAIRTADNGTVDFVSDRELDQSTRSKLPTSLEGCQSMSDGLAAIRDTGTGKTLFEELTKLDASRIDRLPLWARSSDGKLAICHIFIRSGLGTSPVIQTDLESGRSALLAIAN